MKKKVLITVKTYPTLSNKYDETVCTAGIDEDGNWIRIYPVPYRKLYTQYNKYQWIELDLIKRTKDPRPESLNPTNVDNIKLLNTLGTENSWQERKKFIFKTKIYTNKKEIIDLAHDNKLSLVTFKPSKITGFNIKPTDREWPQEKVELIKSKAKQESLFEEAREFVLMPKIPYIFSYIFEDDEGVESKLMIEDWEAPQLYLNMMKKENDEEKACQAVKDKYMGFVKNKDIYLFLGTTYENHLKKNRNPFVITGVFYPPIKTQGDLFSQF